MNPTETFKINLNNKEETIASIMAREARTIFQVIKEEISIQEMKDQVSEEMRMGMDKEIFKEEMDKTVVSREGMDRMEDSRGEAIRMGVIREETMRMTKVERTREGVHLAGTTRKARQ